MQLLNSQGCVFVTPLWLEEDLTWAHESPVTKLCLPTEPQLSRRWVWEKASEEGTTAQGIGIHPT